MRIQQDELNRSNKWWRAMSINEMKALEAKYNVIDCHRDLPHIVHELWVKEGKPC
jgi:hypothetical protein